jgi:hypothetical protein
MPYSSWPPDPETGGALNPPNRRPPTAVGVATPPPPDEEPRYRNHLLRLRRRLAEGFTGAVFAGSAVGIATVGSLATSLLAVGLGAVGGAFLYRAMQSRLRHRQGVALKLISAARRYYRKGRRAA